MLRLGLCCIFREQPITFRRTTAAALRGLTRHEQLERLSEICLHNAHALVEAVAYCAESGIGCFRINSQLLPLYTHPALGYRLRDLPGWRGIVRRLEAVGALARASDVRTTFHPDQFVVLNSPNDRVVRASVEELQYQADVAAMVAADVINIHGGGAYGAPGPALDRLRRALARLSERIRSMLTLENDDRVWRPRDLLPVCAEAGIPLVYDVHHHRVLPDGLTEGEVTRRAAGTWDREPLFHVSSPLEGWRGPGAHRHHDFVRPKDVPACWLRLRRHLTIEVEAKAKEVAVLRLRRALVRAGARLR